MRPWMIHPRSAGADIEIEMIHGTGAHQYPGLAGAGMWKREINEFEYAWRPVS